MNSRGGSLLLKVLVGLLVGGGLLSMQVSPASAMKLKLFQSPSGNIGCAMLKSGVRCDIANHTWPTPKTPKSCPLDYGNGLIVGTKGRGRFVCAGDTTLHQGKVLPYGAMKKLGHFKCISQTGGMRCINHKTGHGFRLSIAHATRF